VLSIRSEDVIRDMARHDDIIVYYDNFDYMQKVRHQAISDHGVMYNYTTAKLGSAWWDSSSRGPFPRLGMQVGGCCVL